MAGGRQTLHSERFCGRSNGRIKPIVPDAASVMSGGFAQKANFAKLERFPDSGPLHRLRRITAQSELTKTLIEENSGVKRTPALNHNGVLTRHDR